VEERVAARWPWPMGDSYLFQIIVWVKSLLQLIVQVFRELKTLIRFYELIHHASALYQFIHARRNELITDEFDRARTGIP
jgi:hypothetical protein